MNIENILSIIDINGNTQKILLELFSNGPQTAAFLSKKLSIPRPSVYDALHILEKRSLVVFQEDNGKKIFSPTNPEYISTIIDESSNKILQAKDDFSKIIPTLLKSPRITEPKIRMFSGRDGCQQVMRDILWYKNIKTYTLWPMHKMIEILTPEFLEWHNKRRVENNLYLKSTRKFLDKDDIKKYPFMGDKKEDLREVRFLPESVDFSMSYWIYGDNVAFVSAGEELYGFIVHSKEFSEMMLLNFNLFWDIAKK